MDSIIAIGLEVDGIIFKGLSKGASPNFVPLLRYQIEAGGKRMRAAMTILSCVAAGGRAADALRPAAAVELIHNYSLVMDDLIDHGKVRRGKPTLRIAGGDSVSLLIAMYYREVLDEILEACVRRAEIRQVAVHAMKEIIDGERRDLLFEQAGRNEPYLLSNRVTNPNFPCYLAMIGKKTAALFRAAGEAGGHAAQANTQVVKALGEFGWKAGLAFQVMDDVLDIYGDKTGKETAKDIMEHKLGNAAVLVALRYLDRSRKTELLRILRSEKVSKSMARRGRSLVLQTPAERECKEVAQTYLEQAKNQLAVLSRSKYRNLLVQLSDHMVSRKF